MRIMLADLKFEPALRALGRKYSPDQPRMPAGNPDGGQWTSGDGGQSTNDQLTRGDQGVGSQSATQPDPMRVAQYNFGALIGQARILGGGWMCFYKFDFGTVMVPGATNLGCSTFMPAAGVSHGTIISNDN